MKVHKLLLIAVTIQLIGLISGGTESLSTTSAVPFQIISPAEFQAISDLSDGKPFITQKRLLSSSTVTTLIKSIFTGLIRFVYITGLDSALDSVGNAGGPTKGYPFCSIQANGNNKHIHTRSLDGFDVGVSNLGTYHSHFFFPGIVKFENLDKNTKTEEFRHFLKKDFHKFHHQPAPNYGPPPEANKDKETGPAPVYNCIVVLKESSDPETTTPAPAPPPSPPPPPPTADPSSYHQQPNSFPPGHTLGSYQVVALPYPPYLGLVGAPSSAPLPQAYPSNTPSFVIPPAWPYWPMADPYVVTQ